MGRHRRRYSHSLRDNVIQLRHDDDPAKLAEDWEREVVAKLNRDAEYYAQILKWKPSINLVLQIWQRSRDDAELVWLGTADPELWERRKAALEAAERRMSALIDEIEAHNAEVRARRAKRC